VNAALPWLLPFALQGLAMGVDEFRCHAAREVTPWEWRGHVLDTAVFLACLACAALLDPGTAQVRLFAGLAVLSCLLVTKDEFRQHLPCTGGEHWLHAVLFLLHPMVLFAAWRLWTVPGGRGPLLLEAALTAGFLAYQALLGAGRPRAAINNAIYEDLGERWYEAQDDPVALLRAEARLLVPWVASQLADPGLRILDVGCGGGFLANPMAALGHRVTGIDLAPASLVVARRHDGSRTAIFLAMDARQLAFPDETFDAVCMMDFLEHVADKEAVIREASRVLKPGGLLFFHTFNRTALSWLIAIKGVAWSVANTPRHLHVLPLFMKPAELTDLCGRYQVRVEQVLGVNPRVRSWAFLRMLLTARVGDGFQFQFTHHLGIAYCGVARKAGG